VGARGTGVARTRARLSSVANAMRVVKAFSDDEYEMGISNLARRLTLPKSTVHRLSSTLVDAGFLERNPETGGYRLGLALFDLGMLVRRKMNVVTEARPYLRALMERTAESVHLTVLDHASVLYVNNIASPQAISMQSNLGARVPPHCCSEGKAMLAFMPAAMVDGIISAGLVARTPKTIVRASRLRAELAQVRSRGYALDDEELEIGLRSAAAPIRDHRGDVVAAVSIAGPVQRVGKKALQRFAVEAVVTGRTISQRLGYHADTSRTHGAA
jgi:DNA-binding IclR family transcriptional regulator